mgnify:FL=1
MISDSVSPERFRDNPALKGREDRFLSVEVKVAPVLASWQTSLFAHEWMTAEGRIKAISEMADPVVVKRRSAETAIAEEGILDRPVLGIGIMDNIEIGSGKDLFLTLAAHGATHIPVHIPKSHEQEFRMFIR